MDKEFEQHCYVNLDGSKHWYKNGKRHREDGPAVEYADGYKKWYINGLLHREDGPAVEYDDDKRWYVGDFCIDNLKHYFLNMLKYGDKHDRA